MDAVCTYLLTYLVELGDVFAGQEEGEDEGGGEGVEEGGVVAEAAHEGRTLGEVGGWIE